MAAQPPSINQVSPPPPPRPRVRNLYTQARIRRDVLWQIGLPLGLAVAVVITLAVLLILPGGAPARSPWADVSLILLILPATVLGALVLVLVAALVVGLYFVLRELPGYFKLAQDFMAVAAYRIQTGAAKVSGVFLSIRSAAAGAQRVAQDLRRAVQRGG